MSMKKLRQKVAAALIIAMSATNVLSAAAAPVGSPSKKAAVKVTFLGGEGGSWNKEIASKSTATASKSDATDVSGSNTGPISQIERTYIVDRNEGSRYLDDEQNSFINLEWSKEFKNGDDWEQVEQEGYDLVGWYSSDGVYINPSKTQIYDGAKLIAKWQSAGVKAPDVETNIEEVIVSGLEDGQQFILKDIEDDSEADAKRLPLLTETLGKESLQLASDESDIIKLDIHVDGHKKGQEVTITLAVPDNWLVEGFGDTYDVSAIHFKSEDDLEILPVKVDADHAYMTFVVKNGFSPFYIAKTAVQDPDAPKDVKVTIRNVEHGYVEAWTYTEEGKKYLPIGEEVLIPAKEQPIFTDAWGYYENGVRWECDSLSAVPKAEGNEPKELGNVEFLTEDCEIVATFKEVEEEDDDPWHREFNLVLEPDFVSEEDLDYTGKVVRLRRYNEETDKMVTVPESDWSLRPADEEDLIAEGCGYFADMLDVFDFDPETNTLTSKSPLKRGIYPYPVVITYQGEDYAYYYSRNIGKNQPYSLDVEVGTDVRFFHSFVKPGDVYSSSTSGFIGSKEVCYKDDLTWGIAKPDERDLDYGEPQMYGYIFKGWQSHDGKKFTSDAQKLVSIYEDEAYFQVFDLFEKEDGTKYEPKALGYKDDDNDPSKPNDSSRPGSSPGGGSSGGGSGSAAKDYTMHGTWIANGDGWKFLKDSGEYAVNNWGFINGKWYYFDAQGNMVTGWYQVNGQWYFMTPEKGANEGVMVTGWHLDTTYHAWFYLGASGAMVTGWQQINGAWYYLNPVSDGTKGAMAVNTNVDGYFVNADGVWVP